MDKERLFQNRAEAAAALKRQTGKEVGEPTGMCAIFMGHALTGTEPRYLDYGSQAAVEDELFRIGLMRHGVLQRGADRLAVVPGILDSPYFGVDAVVVNGNVQGDELVGHMVAVVPTTEIVGEEEKKEYHVVDSLAKDGLATYSDHGGVMSHLIEVFKPESVSVGVTPTEQEIEHRMQPEDTIPVMEMVEVGPGAFIETPMSPADPRFAQVQDDPYTEQIGNDLVEEGDGDVIVISERYQVWEREEDDANEGRYVPAATPDAMPANDREILDRYFADSNTTEVDPVTHTDVFHQYGLDTPMRDSTPTQTHTLYNAPEIED